MFLANPESTKKNSWKFMFHFLEGCKVSFSFMINSYIGMFEISIENFYLAGKQRKFRETIRRFRNRENM